MGWAWIVGVVVVSGCRDDATEPQEQGETGEEAELIYVCDGELLAQEFTAALTDHTNMFFRVGTEAGGGTQSIHELASQMSSNAALAGPLQPEFADGEYRLNDGGTLTLYFAQDVGEWSAGEAIPYNVLDLDSYALNIEIDIDTSVFPPVIEATWDDGPLMVLVDGEPQVDAVSTTLQVPLRLDLIDLEAYSEGTYEFPYVEGPEWTMVLFTTRFNLGLLHEDLEAAGFGWSIDGTRVESIGDWYLQEFFNSELLSVRQPDGSYAAEGSYDAWLDIPWRMLRLHLHGEAIANTPDRTEYFCDEARTERIGVAVHDDIGEGGVFTFEDGREHVFGPL